MLETLLLKVDAASFGSGRWLLRAITKKDTRLEAAAKEGLGHNKPVIYTVRQICYRVAAVVSVGQWRLVFFVRWLRHKAMLRRTKVGEYQKSQRITVYGLAADVCGLYKLVRRVAHCGNIIDSGQSGSRTCLVPQWSFKVSITAVLDENVEEKRGSKTVCALFV